MIMKEWGETIALERKKKWIYATIVMLCCALYAGFLSTKGMPPTEGWYSYYAYLINEKGAIPYVDFELLFPPLYTYLIAFFTSIFGYSIMALRIFGIVIYTVTGLFAFLIFDKLTNKPMFATFAGLLAVSVLQSEIVQIFYDYIRLMDLSVYASIYFFLCAIERIETREHFFLWEQPLVLGAVCAVLASMFKQSSGLIFLLFCLAFFAFAIFVLPQRKRYAMALGTILLVTLLMYGVMALALLQNGALSAYFQYNFKAAMAAKGGSIWSVLFGFLFRQGPILILYAVVVLAVIGGLWWLCRYLSYRYPRSEEEEEIRMPLLLAVLGVIVMIATVGFTITYDRFVGIFFGDQKPFTAIIVAMTAFAVISVGLIVARVRKKAPHEDAAKLCFFTGAVFLLAYAVCTSGGLAESQIALGYPLVAMLFLPVLQFRKRELAALLLAALMLSTTLLGFEHKVRTIYNWWGLEVGSIEKQTETVDLPLLRGIYMDKTYAKMYTKVVHEVQALTDENEEIFVFPHIPIFYLLCDRPRATNTAIQWFDVSTDEAVIKDIKVLREKKPKVMVVCMISDDIIEVHEAFFRQDSKSGLREMQNFLEDFFEDEEYCMRSAYTISPHYTVAVWYLPDATN